MTTDMRFADKTVADMVLMYLALEAALAEAKKDAERYRFLKERLHGADFMYGENEISVLLFSWPHAVSANLDKSVDTAMRGEGE